MKSLSTNPKQAEEDLQKKDRLLQAIAKAIHEIISNNQLELALGQVIVLLGGAMQLDKVHIYCHVAETDGMAFVDQMASWHADSDTVEYRIPVLQHIPAALVPFSLGVLGRNEMYAKSVSDLDDEVLRSLLESRKVRSVACLPIFVRGRFWGFISLNDCRQERDWSIELSLLQSFFVTLGAVIGRRSSFRS